MIDFGIAGTRRSLEDVGVGCQHVTPAGAKYVQRSLHRGAVKVSLGILQIRLCALRKQSQEDRLENVFRVIRAPGDDTGRAIYQLVVVPEDLLNPWDCWRRHLYNRCGRHVLLDVKTQHKGGLLTSFPKKAAAALSTCF